MMLSNLQQVETVVSADLLALVKDGLRFVRRHAGVIAIHPLLVYSSALSFTPSKTVLYQTFHDDYKTQPCWV